MDSSVEDTFDESTDADSPTDSSSEMVELVTVVSSEVSIMEVVSIEVSSVGDSSLCSDSKVVDAGIASLTREVDSSVEALVSSTVCELLDSATMSVVATLALVSPDDSPVVETDGMETVDAAIT